MDGLAHEEGRTLSADGLALYWQAWLPAVPRAVLLFVHGLGEHSGRYQNPVAYFARRGFACYASDYRGHGRSPGPRVHVDTFQEFGEDVLAARALVQHRHPMLPQVLVGHSQGGLVALASVLDQPQGLAGLVLSSPFLGIHPSAGPSSPRKALAALLARASPRLRLSNNVDAAWLSHDPAVAEAYRSDPLVSRRVSAGWFSALRQAFANVRARAAGLRLPTLLMASPDDHLVDPQATRRFLERAPSALVEAVWWDGFYHELFNELEKERVFSRMERWLRRWAP